MHIYIGTYTTGRAEGIYHARLDAKTGHLELVGVTADVANPSFLALHPNGRVLYAANETDTLDAHAGGGVSAFRIEPTTGGLERLNRQPSGGDSPCHLTVDATGRCVLLTNYNGGTVAAFPLGADGALEPRSCLVHHSGMGPHPDRQQSPHPHSINLSPDNRFAFVADLGTDTLTAYLLDAHAPTLTPCPDLNVALTPGAGPRHFTFAHDARAAYLINELDSTLVTFAYEEASGTLTPRQTISTLPASYRQESTTAEVALHASGRWLYASNRGHDSLAVFAVNPGDRTLTLAQHVPTLGAAPRHFAIDPTGRYGVVANQNSGTVAVFRVDQDAGTLTPTNQILELPDPVCVRFATGA